MPEMADYIKNNITKDMVLDFFNERILNNNQTLSVHILGAQNTNPLDQAGLKQYLESENQEKQENSTVIVESYLKHISSYKDYRTLSEIRDMKKSCYLYPAQVPNTRDEELLYSRVI